jgi:hypothetical protein
MLLHFAQVFIGTNHIPPPPPDLPSLMIIIIYVKTPLELAKISVYRKIVLMSLGELIRSKNVSFNTGFVNQVV